MNPIRVLILDDSEICRAQLRAILEADGDIKVVGEAHNGANVLELIERTHPNVLLVDVEMPGTPGHVTIERVMANHPLPILVVTGVPTGTTEAGVFEAIRRGALQLAAKPLRGDRAAEAGLRVQVKRLARIPVVRHVAGKLGVASPSGALPRLSAAPARPEGALPLVVGVGASAGGPMALATMLEALPQSFGAAVAVVQHLPIGFAHAFADFLQNRTSLPVRIVDKPERVEVGRIYVAPDAQHLALEGKLLTPVSSAPVEGHRPSVDVLFRSLVASCGARAAGVLMSGMGRDGVAGLSSMRRVGALTLAQDEASCGVFGMPMAALREGAAESTFPPVTLARVLDDWAKASVNGGTD
jgi:two-component system chemotaxis response regulator CheB